MPINILGIDPASTRNMGVCVARIYKENKKMEIKERFTNIFNVTNDTKDDRFVELENVILELIKKYNIKKIIYERTIFGKSFVMSQISENMGVTKLIAKKNDIELVPFSPKSAKLMITGSGKATKKEMMKAVNDLFGLRPKDLSSDHEADAISMCYYYSLKYKNE